jgi:acetyl-CoA carboxylase biotin carboxyl carrier protein
MRVEEIKRLVELVEQSGIGELEVRRWWGTVRISKVPRGNGQVIQVTPDSSHASHPSPPPAAVQPQAAAPPGPAEEPPEEGIVTIVSPMVGTFYRSASSSVPSYVEINGRVTAGQVVCIVEAMKLMNEIESEISGTITRILVENGQPVEFNQPLFRVRPD